MHPGLEIPVVWQSYNKDFDARLFGDQIFVEDLMIKNNIIMFENFEQLERSSNQSKGVIVIIRLNFNVDFIDLLNKDIARFKWVLIICTTNEIGSPEYANIKHPNMKLWLMMPRDNDVADRFLGIGCPTRMVDQTPQRIDVQYDWFFAGQITHSRRVQCANVLKELSGGELIQTDGFNQGLPYPDYIGYMMNSNVIPCPGGPENPDTFRVYEALELGCIPVVDKHAAMKHYNISYWDKIFGPNPLSQIDDWKEFPVILKYELEHYKERKEEIGLWWAAKKYQINQELLEDIESLL